MARVRLGAFLAVAAALAVSPAAWHQMSAAALPDDPASIAHVLNRLTFGSTPGDVDEARRLGLERWVDQQLHPETIDDSAIEARLVPLASPPDSTDPRELRRFARRQIVVLSTNKIIRSVYSERQLEEVLVDFWFNHFNVYAAKGRTAQFLPEYERDVIRPHVLGHFRELVGATAKSPAMLFYLDNWRNTSDDLPALTARRQRLAAQRPAPKRARGLNENYGRELLELHTLGVDGGYTQDDVVAVARAFTGWTIDREGDFRFVRLAHDAGAKVVLGQTIRSGGVEEGEQVLDILARHPATARHIAFKLTQWLVADEPPQAIVDRAAARFSETDGDLREVVRAIVLSPEFTSPDVRGGKFKTPLELVASALRVTGADVRDGRALVQVMQELGEPLFLCQPPTGYHDTADTWVSAGGLVSRMNFASRLASNRLPGIAVASSSTDPEALAQRLGSPEFQRH